MVEDTAVQNRFVESVLAEVIANNGAVMEMVEVEVAAAAGMECR